MSPAHPGPAEEQPCPPASYLLTHIWLRKPSEPKPAGGEEEASRVLDLFSLLCAAFLWRLVWGLISPHWQ